MSKVPVYTIRSSVHFRTFCDITTFISTEWYRGLWHTHLHCELRFETVIVRLQYDRRIDEFDMFRRQISHNSILSVETFIIKFDVEPNILRISTYFVLHRQSATQFLWYAAVAKATARDRQSLMTKYFGEAAYSILQNAVRCTRNRFWDKTALKITISPSESYAKCHFSYSPTVGCVKVTEPLDFAFYTSLPEFRIFIYLDKAFTSHAHLCFCPQDLKVKFILKYSVYTHWKQKMLLKY